jgi:outer membrane receptor protein involved in Fe transport
LTSLFTYRNVGEIIDQGVELGIQWNPSPTWSAFLNYSYQADPEVSGIEPVLLPGGELIEPVNVPPTNRFNVGGSYSGRRFFASAVVNYQDEAFWTDVLNELFWGPTDAFTTVGLGAGVYLAGDKVTLSVNGTNVFDEEILQHIFGDIIGRKWTGQVRFRF